MRCFAMPPGCIPTEVFQACATGKKPQGRPNNKLEGLYILSGLGTPWDFPRGEGEQGWRRRTSV